MADILVTSPFQPFTLPTQFKAVFNGHIYCGEVGAVDPSVSQVQVYLVNESGDKVPVAQPLRTNAGGFMVYNGQPVKFVTDSNHSLLVQDSLQVQVWYEPDMAMVDPQTFFDALSGPGGADMVGLPNGTVADAIWYVTPEMYGAVSYPKTTLFGANKNSAADIAAAVAASTVVDSTDAIQQAVNSGKNVRFGAGVYYTSKPITQLQNTGDIQGHDTLQTAICKYTKTTDTTYSVDAVWIVGDGAGSYMRYKKLARIALVRTKFDANSGTLQQPKAVENFFDFTDVNLIPYGYGLYIPKADHFDCSGVVIQGSDTGFYSADMWMSRLINVWSHGGTGFVVETGTSNTWEQVWALHSSWNIYDTGGNLVKKHYCYDIGGVYLDLSSLACDFAGGDGRPTETLYNFRQGTIAEIGSLGSENCHARRIISQVPGASGFTTGFVHASTISVDMFHNRYGDTSLPAKRRVLFDVGDFNTLTIESGRVRCVYADRTTAVGGITATNKPDIAYVGLTANLDLAKTYLFIDYIRGVQLNSVSYFRTYSGGTSTPVAITSSEIWVDSNATNASSFTICNGAVDLTVSGGASSLFWDNGSTAKPGTYAHRFGGYMGVASGAGNAQMRVQNDNVAASLVTSGTDYGLFDYSTGQWVIRQSNAAAANEWSLGSTVFAGDAILNFKAHGSTAYTARLVGRSSGGTGLLAVQSYNAGGFVPFNDNSMSLGQSGGRWTVVYAATGTINTSDEREKTRLNIEDAERAAALEIKQNMWKFQFNAANEEKAGNGRIHFGVGAQTVGEILTSHGLDPDRYAFYCYDEWDDQLEDVMETRTVELEDGTTREDTFPTGEKRVVTQAGNRYGIRYDELLCFIIAAM